MQGTQLLDDRLPKVDPTVELESGWLAVYVTQTTPLQVQHGDLDKNLAAIDAADSPIAQQTMAKPPPSPTATCARAIHCRWPSEI